MPTAAQVTLYVVIVATILALVAVILLAVFIVQHRAQTGGTGLTGSSSSSSPTLTTVSKTLVGPGMDMAYGDGSAGDAVSRGRPASC